MDRSKGLERVMFRRFRAKPRDVIAFLPDQDEVRGYMMSYQHVGQHGAASYPNPATIPADVSEPDVAALKAELERIGYRLRVVKRNARRKP